ncbi:hypothetical protein FJTKL_05906 [Diaporthe vaccinii]|uniref:Uncharacterized protein n=1 Tax=Diaporthe vaccinii TaxID=105482 RepID=A0ABR4EYD3_9PEZI
MPSPDIRVTSGPSQTWAHGHVHLQILARLSLVPIPPNPPESRSNESPFLLLLPVYNRVGFIFTRSKLNLFQKLYSSTQSLPYGTITLFLI